MFTFSPQFFPAYGRVIFFASRNGINQAEKDLNLSPPPVSKMPFYEGIGLIAEKNAVVLDLGHAYTKVGYAGEAAPRAIVRTPPELRRQAQADLAHGRRDALRDALVRFVHRLYFTHLLVNPKDRRVVLVDQLLGSIAVKEVLSEVLFKHYEVLSILYAPSHLMPLFTLGLRTGLVLDAGFAEATLIPVYEGVPILKAWQAQPLASEAVHGEIAEMLRTRGTVRTRGEELQKLADKKVEISDKVVEDIKVRLCFVTSLNRGHQIQKLRQDGSSVSGLSSFLKKSVPTASYPIGGDSVLHVDGQTRESVCEVMFEQDADCMSVSTMVLDAILASPIDTRRELARNLIVVGGTSMLVGFKARLVEELKHLLAEAEPYKDKLSIEELKLHTPPTKPNYTCWTGASIFGATDAISTRSFTREMYLKENCAVPDWSNLRFNSLLAGNEDRQG